VCVSIRVCVCARDSTFVHSKNVRASVHVRVYMCTLTRGVHESSFVHINNVHASVCVCVYMCTCVLVCAIQVLCTATMCVPVCVYACVYACICVCGVRESSFVHSGNVRASVCLCACVCVCVVGARFNFCA